MLNDIEFINGFSTELSDDYRLAKSYVRDIPTQALVYIRSFTHKLAAQLAQLHDITFTSANLYDRIEQLNQQRVIDVAAVRALHRLRTDGNRGAHPEKYHLTQVQLINIAEKSIHHILQLIEKLYQSLRHCTAPHYQFEAFDSYAGRDLCYRAVMQNDSEAQYLVGMSLKAKGLMLQEQEHALAQSIDDASSTISKTLNSSSNASMASEQTSADVFSQAAHWFSLASGRHQTALFEHGVSLLHGYSGKVNSAEGERFIAQAAEQGVVNAQALLGFFYLVGSDQFEVDINQAETLLTLAANAENAEAMSNLGVLFYQHQQFEQAYLWVNKAAQTGYPHAQYHLALMLEQGQGCNVDITKSQQWMQEAAEQGQLDAMLRCGSDILHDDAASQQQLETAEHYLHQVIKYGRNVTAMIELSVALADGILGRIDVVQAAYLLQQANLHADDIQRQVIEPLWQSLLMQIDSVIALNPTEAELAALQQAKRFLG
ncbi:tetratricopeptide repeat protein [Shewanella sp. MEBiC00475]|uniref:tetratricopeptide repeat protein n=1 Tax=Shewanella sp. MEBiC00475 TaxID=2575361 RepID=UPI0010C0A8A3|nr:tetratricopeptide repeat protein [Shewanella sp. MEBiC00475]